MAKGSIPAPRIIKRPISGGDPTHNRAEQAIKDIETPRQLQPAKEPPKYNYLGEKLP